MICFFCKQGNLYYANQDSHPALCCDECDWITPLYAEDVSLDRLAQEIALWNAEQFPGGTLLSYAKHLQKEVTELVADLEAGKNSKSEWVDVFFFFANASHKIAGVREGIRDKLAKNKRRKWQAPDKDGVCEHVRGHED